MAKININIEKLALLARIKLTLKEKQKFQKEFEEILNYISKLEQADVSNITEMEAGKATELENVMREDSEPYEPDKFTEDLLKEVPSKDKNFIKVKHILE